MELKKNYVHHLTTVVGCQRLLLFPLSISPQVVGTGQTAGSPPMWHVSPLSTPSRVTGLVLILGSLIIFLITHVNIMHIIFLAVFKGRDPKIIISTSIPLCEGEEHAMCY
jgi:hypothetical protein